MALRELSLVRPPEMEPVRLEGIAHRALDVYERARTFDSLSEAIADASFVVGTSARARTARRNYVQPREVAGEIIRRARVGRVAVVFGREDRGLTNEALDRCQRVAIIPTHPDYSSLNLAQACLVLSYEIFLAAGGSIDEMPTGRRQTRPARSADLEDMYGALEEGLERIEFFKSRHPDTVLRTLRTALARADLGLREARLIRAIGFEIGHYLDRVAPRAGREAEE